MLLSGQDNIAHRTKADTLGSGAVSVARELRDGARAVQIAWWDQRECGTHHSRICLTHCCLRCDAECCMQGDQLTRQIQSPPLDRLPLDQRPYRPCPRAQKGTHARQGRSQSMVCQRAHLYLVSLNGRLVVDDCVGLAVWRERLAGSVVRASLCWNVSASLKSRREQEDCGVQKRSHAAEARSLAIRDVDGDCLSGRLLLASLRIGAI